MTPKACRSTIVSALTDAGLAGGRIYDSPTDPHKLTGRNAIFVFIPNRSYECVDPFDDISFKPTYSVEIDAVVSMLDSNSASYMDDLDDLVEEIKTTLFGDESIFSLFSDMPSITETIDLSVEAEYRLLTCQIVIDLQVCQITY